MITPIVTITPSEIVESSPKLDNKQFNAFIFDKGYDCFIDKALRCPCCAKSNGQALSNCKNCLGKGWFFVNRSQTRVVFQGMSANKKYENWTEETTGMARVTARGIDKLGLMDRITIVDAETIFSEILRPEVYTNDLIAYTNYPVLEVEEIYLFQGINQKFKILMPDVDYVVTEDSIKFDDSYKTTANMSVAIRYIHNLIYHVMEMNRDVMKTRIRTNCGSDSNLVSMPINGVVRKAHYVFTQQRFEERGTLLENSNV